MEMALKVSGVVLIGAVASLLLKEKNRSFSFAVVMCALITVVIFCIKSGLYQSISDISQKSETPFSGVMPVLLKALGVSYITGITAELCSSAGENSLAAAVGFAGKTEILILCLPLVTKLLQIAGGAL